ncbi:LysM peptidoglycan-binding domain-containing protein [Cohnella xylanilytica]|uniref:LysM peptidoglycan-binding domain-containing protein n=1 Tax=Cohnella xylanilytica TaxID=557555 RepID=UPI0021AABEEB|nr:LysM peptidoglycan-binding domain-containing protein [Cohnella xylanilytica]
MTESLNGLRFDIYERVHLPEDVAAIDELEEIELVPHMQAISLEDQIVLRGHLLLTASYRTPDERSDLHPLEHWIPVEISLPPSRVEKLEDLAVEIDNFDVDLLSSRSLNVTGVLGLKGLQVAAPQTPVWREDGFTIVHQAPGEPEVPFGESDVREGYLSRQRSEAGQDGPQDPAVRLPEPAGRPEPAAPEEAPSAYYESEASAAPPVQPDHPYAAYSAYGAGYAPQPPEAPYRPPSPEPQAPSASGESPGNEEPEPRSPYSPYGAKDDLRQREPWYPYASYGGTGSANPDVPTYSSYEPAEDVRPEPAHPNAPYGAQENAIPEFDPVNAPYAGNEPPAPSFLPYKPIGSAREEAWGDVTQERLESDGRAEPEWQQDVLPEEKPELKVALNAKPPSQSVPSASSGVGLLSQIGDRGARRESELRSAAEEAQQAALAANAAPAYSAETSGDEIEWTRLFLSKSTESQPFRKVKICIVQREDTLDAIAARYNVQLRELQLHNRLADPHVTEGQVIYIP